MTGHFRLLRRVLGPRALAALLVLAFQPAGIAPAQQDAELASEIARLRSRLAANVAEQQQCLAGATPRAWVAPAADDVRLVRERARQNGGQAWRELEKQLDRMEAQARANARSGNDLLVANEIGLSCLERGADERDALRAALELALSDPAGYKASLADARKNGDTTLRRDLKVVHEAELAVASRFKARAPSAELTARGRSLGGDLATVRQRHAVALLTAANRALADPVLRAGEALLATLDAWEREQNAKSPGEREEASRLRESRWGSTEQLLAELAARR
ncbi:MAG TPA: hypothetical protein VFN71_06900 [Methylomirabilota bacterium]|nr:hypothetical protein [Methylomirabilota bacterium]